MTKLVGTGRMGDFVHANQQMGAEDGFKNVSKIWLDQTITFEKGMEAMEEDRHFREDLNLALGEVKPTVNQKDEFTLEFPDGRQFAPSPHSIMQLGAKADIPVGFVRNLLVDKVAEGDEEDDEAEILIQRDRQDAETLVHVFNNGIRRMDLKKKLLWRVNTRENLVRAVLTDQYAIVNNIWFLEVLKEYIPGGRLSHWAGDSDTIYGNILIPDSIREEQDSDYGGMFSIGNSEIGIRKIDCLPSVFRAICMNGCIWDQEAGESLQKRHRGTINLMMLKEHIRDLLHSQIPLLTTGVDKLLLTRTFKYDGASVLPLLAQAATDNRLTKKQAELLRANYLEEVKECPANNKTLFGLINGFTRAGQELSSEGWVKFDKIGGTYANFGKEEWSKLSGRAKLLDTKDVEKVFGKN